jgi:hypothetical protein
MSIGSNSTSNDVFRLLRYLAPSVARYGYGDVTEEEARAAAERLADAAQKRLGAGFRGDDVRRAWRKHKPGPTA